MLELMHGILGQLVKIKLIFAEHYDDNVFPYS